MHLKGLSNIGVSVVIICFNGEKRIVPTLEHLSTQKNVNFGWDILIIDNNSSDNTSSTAKNFWQKHSGICPLRVIKESKSGAMYARKCGMINSNYRYMLFCDDDNWLSDHYVKTAFDRIRSDEKIAAIGGHGILTFEHNFEKPDWISRYSGKFGAGPQGRQDGDITDYKGSIYTAGAILDRVWLSKLYSCGFKPLLPGRDGVSLVAGEDTELTYGLKKIGGRLHYYSDLKFQHFMPSARMNWNYLLKLSKAMEIGNYLLQPYKKQKPDNVFLTILFSLYLIAKYFLKSIFHGFKEGDDNQVYMNMFIGRLQAIISGKKLRCEMYDIINNLNNCS